MILNSGNLRPADIIYVSDDQYVVPLTVSIRSVQCNTVTSPTITVLCDEVSEASKLRILQSLPKPAAVQLVDLDPASLPNRMGRGISSKISRTALARLKVAPELVNDRSFVYLDADTVVRTDIGRLLQHDLGDNVLAATYDHYYTGFARRTQRLSAAGAAPGRRFNSGVMLIATARWFTDRIGERAEHVAVTARIMDQGALNVVCQDRWHELDPGWNVTTQVLLRSKWFQTAPEQVFIRHLTAVKPWITPSPLRDTSRLMLHEFSQHLAQTVWATEGLTAAPVANASSNGSTTALNSTGAERSPDR